MACARVVDREASGTPSPLAASAGIPASSEQATAHASRPATVVVLCVFVLQALLAVLMGMMIGGAIMGGALGG